jgi:signal transduction histidine kinase
MQKNKVYVLLVWLGIFLMSAAVLLNMGNSIPLSKVAARASLLIEKKATQCRLALGELISRNNLQAAPDKYFATGKIGLYLFVKDSLVYWNNSRVPVKSLTPFTQKQGFAKLTSGYYVYFRATAENKTGLAVCQVKPDYELQNNYLTNAFSDWTGIPEDVGLDTGSVSGPGVMLAGEKIFSLNGSEGSYHNPEWDDWCVVAFIAGFLLFLTAFLIKISSGISGRQFSLLLALAVVLRLAMVAGKWPQFFYRSVLYDVRLFGNARSFVNAYLGDILLNALVLMFLSLSAYFYLKSRPGITRLAKFALLPGLVLLIACQYNLSIVSLVTNSTLNFDFLNIFNVTIPALIGLSAICVNSLALFIVLKIYTGYFFTGRLQALWFMTIILLICVIQHFICGQGIFEDYWLLIFAGITFMLVNVLNVQLSLALGSHILLMSAITSVILNKYIDKNQEQDLEILSITLSERQDAILESEFSHLPGRIKADKSLQNLINILPSTSEAIEQLLHQKFFNEYFNRYYVDFCMFDSNCRPLLEPKNPVLLNEGFFDEQIRYRSDSTSVEGLFFVKQHRQNARYIGKIALGEKRLYILMEPKQFEELGSFPDLLLDKSQQKHDKLKNFSYAVYRSQQNSSHFGNFNYPMFLPAAGSLAKSDPSYIHQYVNADENTVIIISRSAKTWIYFFTFNSYLLLFFSFIIYCSYLLFALCFTSVFKTSSLNRRIQTIIIGLLLVAMSAIGVTSARLVISQFEAENRKQLREKTEIILNELLMNYKAETLFDKAQKEMLNLKLNEYARLFNTDISLFNKQGFLFNTSQPRLYNMGLASTLANPWALYELRNNLSSATAFNERAGTLKYLSLYTPLFDASHRITGFINLPYFARQNDLVNELSGIISALINVYVILFVISILGGLIFSGYITKPLRLIQQQIANITLGRKNEKISWQTNDEIGRLIGEYNEMLVKLENSANLLAQSERESAWREMAKQVAHEIKNPLTPMKLNLQYLQHLMKNDPAAFGEKFEKASAGIIEQINSLANIANEFSNFAKLPGTQLQTINLAEVINTALLIFENQKNIAIINQVAEPEILVKGDRDQCIRVFNNVLKNAVQALEEAENPVIEIMAEMRHEAVVISIRDNGSGIAGELQPKIFTPNFTTKSTGSGLGLAMVKNIMQGFGGNVWFESGRGRTVFYLQFVPEHQEELSQDTF